MPIILDRADFGTWPSVTGRTELLRSLPDDKLRMRYPGTSIRPPPAMTIRRWSMKFMHDAGRRAFQLRVPTAEKLLRRAFATRKNAVVGVYADALGKVPKVSPIDQPAKRAGFDYSQGELALFAKGAQS